MTVEELMNILKDCPGDAEVTLTDYAFALDDVTPPFTTADGFVHDKVQLEISHKDMEDLALG